MTKILTCLIVALSVMSGLTEAQETIKPKTCVFKTVNETPLKADVYLPPNDAKQHPVIVYMHGGALILGSRQGRPRLPLRDKLLKAGYVVVSIDYRLAPITKAEDIAKDVEDACKWVRKEGPKLFSIDPDRLVVMGGSAGGYLSRLMGYKLKPAPQAIVSFSGYGDLLWFNEARIKQLPQTIPPFNKTGEEWGWEFYSYTRKYGIWIKEVTGLDPDQDSDKLKKLRPIENITEEYPPTLLAHGKSDDDVPYEQAVKMKQALDTKHVRCEFITVPSGHSSQMIWEYPEIVDQTLTFLESFVGRKPNMGIKTTR
ncbi:alpha/beta fold hydrolase [Planctomycetota bacterium]